jgi:lysophospholipase L1-like esterase
VLKNPFSKLLLLASLTLSFISSLRAEEAVPRVAILGDSITFDGRWATRVESTLRGTPRFADAEIVNFGLSSETVSGLSEPNHSGGKFPRPDLFERLDRILDAYQPTLVLACYGMNDGIYLPIDPARSKAYEDGIFKLKSAVEKHGATIVLITPPLHNADKPSTDPQRYDAVLDHYAERLVARRTEGWSVIDIRPDLKRDVAKAKQETPGFVYAKDGVHPDEQGHEFIATSICRQLWSMWKLPGDPKVAAPEALQILTKRNQLLKLAWLTHTKHTRPGVPAGLPLEEAKTQAAKLLAEYQKTIL